MKFADIIGHKDIIRTLKDMRNSGKIPNALLFSGPSGVGKMRTARAFAQYLHCQNPQNGDSCGKCPSCLQHQKYNNPDLHFSYPIVKKEKEGILISKDKIEEWREMLDKHSYMPPEIWNELLNAENSQPAINVNESEDIISRASLSAYKENLKIFIIWQPEKFRTETANKLLKILEEPFEDTVFILVSNEDSKILPTILSRTQRFVFRPLSNEQIVEFLLKEGVSREEAVDAARTAYGCLEKAYEIAYRPEEIIQFSDLFKNVMRASYGLYAKQLKRLSEDMAAFGREKLIRFLRYMNRLIRENYLYNLQVPALISMTGDEQLFSQRFAPFIHEGNIEDLEREITRSISDIERNGNPKIVMFDLLLLLSRYVRKPKQTELPLMFEEEII